MKTILLAFVIMITTGFAVAQENNNTFTYKVGDLEVVLLSEGQQSGNKGILIGATEDMLSKYAPDGTFPNAVNAFLVKAPNQNILVDAGFGRNLFSNLASAGVEEEQINTIILTHMHGDHIGGLLRDGKKAFPNAKLYLSDTEHNYWMSDTEMNKVAEGSRGGFQSARNVINAYKDALQLFSPVKIGEGSAGTNVFTGIAAYGHTPGHTVFMIESKGQKLLIWGDLTHAMAIQMPYPNVAVTYDVNPELAIKYRNEILDYVAKNNIPVAGMHIAYPGIGVVKKQQTGYQFDSLK